MGTRRDVGIQCIPLRAFGVMDCVLHADEECMPGAIKDAMTLEICQKRGSGVTKHDAEPQPRRNWQSARNRPWRSANAFLI